MKRFLPIAVIVLLLMLVSHDAFSQGCVMCKTGIESSQDGKHVGAAINPAIIYLMVVPYVLLLIFFRKRIFSFFRELRGLWAR